MSYYVKSLESSSALSLLVSLQNAHFGFCLDIRLYFANTVDALEMYTLLHKYMKTQRVIKDYQIMDKYEQLRMHEKGV